MMSPKGRKTVFLYPTSLLPFLPAQCMYGSVTAVFSSEGGGDPPPPPPISHFSEWFFPSPLGTKKVPFFAVWGKEGGYMGGKMGFEWAPPKRGGEKEDEDEDEYVYVIVFISSSIPIHTVDHRFSPLFTKKVPICPSLPFFMGNGRRQTESFLRHCCFRPCKGQQPWPLLLRELQHGYN